MLSRASLLALAKSIYYGFVMMCIFTNIAFSLKTEMFGLNDTAVRKLILDDILQVLKSQVQKYPVKVKFSRTLSDSFSCPQEGLSGMI